MIKSVLYALIGICVWTTSALSDEGWVATLGGAYVVPQEADLKSSSNPTTIDFASGAGVFGAIGYDFDIAWAELELSYRTFDVDSVTETGSAGLVTQTTNGDVAVTALFVNGYYDVDLIKYVRPYVGLGVGVANIDANDVRIPGRRGNVDDSDIAPGGQMMIGLAVPVLDAVEVAAGYRVMLLGDVTGAVTGGSAAGDKDITHVLFHNAEIALRYRF